MNLRSILQNRQILAQNTATRRVVLAGSVSCCTVCPSACHPQKYPRAVYHFRTPSPYGRPVASSVASPMSFHLNTMPWRNIAQADFASCHQRSNRFDHRVGPMGDAMIKGVRRCLSKRGGWRLRQSVVFRPAETHWAIKPLLAAPSEQGQRSSSMGALSKVRSLAQRATLSTASLTRQNAGDAKRSRYLASGRFGTKKPDFHVYCFQWAKKIARQRGRYYETSTVLFCDGSAIVSQRLRQTPRRIKPWGCFPTGATTQQLNLIGPAPHYDYTARPVLLTQGGCLLSTLHIKKDSTCSTRS